MDLVTLHTALEATKGETKFRKNHFYRHVDYGNGYHVVNGEDFTDVEFKSLFEDALAKVAKDLIKIGLLDENGKRISKTAFGKLAYFPLFKRGTCQIMYFQCGKEIVYGFYSDWSNKVDCINQCYEWYLQTLNNNYNHLDNRDIQFGNCGIPLANTSLRIQ